MQRVCMKPHACNVRTNPQPSLQQRAQRVRRAAEPASSAAAHLTSVSLNTREAEASAAAEAASTSAPTCCLSSTKAVRLPSLKVGSSRVLVQMRPSSSGSSPNVEYSAPSPIWGAAGGAGRGGGSRGAGGGVALLRSARERCVRPRFDTLGVSRRAGRAAQPAAGEPAAGGAAAPAHLSDEHLVGRVPADVAGHDVLARHPQAGLHLQQQQVVPRGPGWAALC